MIKLWSLCRLWKKFLPFWSGEKKIYVLDTFIDKLCITVSEQEFMVIKMYKFAVRTTANKSNIENIMWLTWIENSGLFLS